MKNLTETLRNHKTGHGHFRITIDMNGNEIGTTTTNTIAIDAAFDDDYECGEDGYYSSQLEARESLVNEILTANNIEI